MTFTENYPATWEQGAADVIDRCQLATSPLAITETYEHLYECGAWGAIAIKAWREYNSFAANNLMPRDLVKFLAGKQSDYGPRNVLKFGHDGLAVRLWDKVARLENLTKNRDRHSTFESYTDSLIDMIGYVVIDKMLAYGYFELPLDEVNG